MNHGVYFYEDDTFLVDVDNVADFAKEGLERHETVIIVATEQHRGDLKTKLTEDVVDLWAPTSGNYVTLDASTTLAIHAERLAGRRVVLKSNRSNHPIRGGQQAGAHLWRNGRGSLGPREPSRCDTS